MQQLPIPFTTEPQAEPAQERTQERADWKQIAGWTAEHAFSCPTADPVFPAEASFTRAQKRYLVRDANTFGPAVRRHPDYQPPTPYRSPGPELDRRLSSRPDSTPTSPAAFQEPTP